jgi:transposase
VRFTLTAGQKGDAPHAAELIEGLPADAVMADTAYDSDALRQAISDEGALAVRGGSGKLNGGDEWIVRATSA